MSTFDLPSFSPLMRRDFLFGVATSSFQIEGAADSRDKNIWDTFCEQDGTILDKSDGLIACNHYDNWQNDIGLIRRMGFGAYRLSISWPRVILKGGIINKKGIDFYKKLVSGLKDNNIKVFVTLYHWDLPQYLEDEGGWLNRDTAYAFADYVKVVVNELNGLVDSYATLNEPYCSSYLGYEIGTHAPGKTGRKLGRQAAHHLLLAHGLAMQVLKDMSPKTENGIVLNFTTTYAYNIDDETAAEKANQYYNHWYTHPIFTGRYPDIINDLSDDDKPVIEAGDLDIISHPIDFLGVNYYSRMTYKDDGKGWFKEYKNTNNPRTDIGWEIYPDGLVKILTQINERYDLPPVYITENGAAIHDQIEDGVINDTRRIDYYNKHLNAVHDAIDLGVDIRGYFAWSLMDNFEWAYGYTQRFGLVYVDYETQLRKVKASGHAFTALLAGR